MHYQLLYAITVILVLGLSTTAIVLPLWKKEDGGDGLNLGLWNVCAKDSKDPNKEIVMCVPYTFKDVSENMPLKLKNLIQLSRVFSFLGQASIILVLWLMIWKPEMRNVLIGMTVLGSLCFLACFLIFALEFKKVGDQVSPKMFNLHTSSFLMLSAGIVAMVMAGWLVMDQ